MLTVVEKAPNPHALSESEIAFFATLVSGRVSVSVSNVVRSMRNKIKHEIEHIGLFSLHPLESKITEIEERSRKDMVYLNLFTTTVLHLYEHGRLPCALANTGMSDSCYLQIIGAVKSDLHGPDYRNGKGVVGVSNEVLIGLLRQLAQALSEYFASRAAQSSAVAAIGRPQLQPPTEVQPPSEPVVATPSVAQPTPQRTFSRQRDPALRERRQG